MVRQVFLLEAELLLEPQKKHVFADLCKDPRETPSSAASQRQIGPSDAAKLSLVVGDSKQRKTSRIRRAQPLSAWFWVLFPRRTPRPSSCDSTTSRPSHYDNLAPAGAKWLPFEDVF